MNGNRDYIDQMVNYLSSEAKKYKEQHQYLTEEFFDSEELKNNAQRKTDIIFDALSLRKLSGVEFDLYYQVALNEYKSNHPIDVRASMSLRKTTEESWLTEERFGEIKWNYTDRYFEYLKRAGRAEKVIAETYNSSKRIIQKVGDPRSTTEFYVKGLVVGNVQSGKTANFNAVINRAIDSGYVLTIVLSGIMEDLRSQTQLRIEKEVAGYGVIDIATGTKGFKGVAQVEAFGQQNQRGIAQVNMPTSMKHDFKKTLREADFPLNQMNILVCKKNTSVLKNLIIWLSDYLAKDKTRHDIPLLVIDDEADNASLNNMGDRGREYATKINGHIRALLGLFTRKTYLGYTATPFANVLQDRNEAPESKWVINYKEAGQQKTKEFQLVDNLFPEDFIELLFPPSNYIGPKQFFETRLEEVRKITPLIPEPVNDFEQSFPLRVSYETGVSRPAPDDSNSPKAKKDDDFPRHLPDSLKEAIQCFFISTAVRLSRKSAMANSKLYNPHNTMLIHVSRFTNWQTRTKGLVEKYVSEEIESRLNLDKPSDPQSVYGEFERTWNKYYAYVIENIKSYLPDTYEDDFLIPKTFNNDIKPLLVEAVRGVEIKAINSETQDTLSYPDGSEKKYIAIGGNRLSRGFTLEGLTINYFIRNTDYADTLLQMGRWFGYRPGYLDCCKLFTTCSSINKFDLTTLTIEELEQEFKQMNKQGLSPREFALRVKTHPKVLKITRASILRNTVEERVNYSGDIEQSTQFRIDKGKMERAWIAFKNAVSQVKWEVNEERDFLIYKTDAKGLLNFINLENTFLNFETGGLEEWLRLCNTKGKLQNWTIAIKRNTDTGNPILASAVSGLLTDIRKTIRRGPKNEELNIRGALINDGIFKASGKSAQIVAAGSDFALTLDETAIQKCKTAFYEEKAEELRASKGLSEERAIKEARKVTVPDWVYREAMDEKDGILVIYLIDTAKICETAPGVSDKELEDYMKSKSIDLSIPLVGYALGFPKISGDIGGTYVKAKHYSELDMEEDEFEELLNEETE